jgi:hypothetical protein
VSEPSREALEAKFLTDNERQLALAAWAAAPHNNAHKWGNLVLEAYDALAAALSAAQEERAAAEKALEGIIREAGGDCDRDRIIRWCEDALDRLSVAGDAAP